MSERNGGRPQGSRWRRASLVAALAGLVAILVVQWHVERLGGVGPGRYRLLMLVLVWQALAIFAAHAAARRPTAPAGCGTRRRFAGGASGAQPHAGFADQRRPLSLRVGRPACRRRGSTRTDTRLTPRSWRSFRDSWLWPDAAECVRLHKATITSDPAHACTRINRPSVRTIYPPAAEAYFLGAHWLPGPARDHKLQLDAAILSAGLTGLLAFGLRRTGRDPLAVAYYSFGPLAGLDIASDAHVDVLAAAFGVSAILLATLRPRAPTRIGARRRAGDCGQALSGAAAARAASP